MASKEIMKMSADELYKRWQERIEPITHETYHLFSSRQQFQDIERLFFDNDQLHAIGADVYLWLQALWGHDALMSIRRELDDQAGVVNIRGLLYEIHDRPDVLTRRRYLGLVTPEDKGEFQKKNADRGFDKYGIATSSSGDRMDDIVSPEGVAQDRAELEQKTDAAYRYAQMVVAHRAPLDNLEIKIAEINSAIDAIEPAVKKYYSLLTGLSLATVTPTMQFNWLQPFHFAWYVPPKK